MESTPEALPLCAETGGEDGAQPLKVRGPREALPGMLTCPQADLCGPALSPSLQRGGPGRRDFHVPQTTGSQRLSPSARVRSSLKCTPTCPGEVCGRARSSELLRMCHRELGAVTQLQRASAPQRGSSDGFANSTSSGTPCARP